MIPASSGFSSFSTVSCSLGGAVVQMGGRSYKLVEPLQVVISATPVDLPAVLPATGDAGLIFWPAGLGVLLLLGGWRLRRSS